MLGVDPKSKEKKISFDLVTFLVALFLWTFLHSLVAKHSLIIWMKLRSWVPFLRVRRWGYDEVIKITVHVSKVYNEFITCVISTLYTHDTAGTRNHHKWTSHQRCARKVWQEPRLTRTLNLPQWLPRPCIWYIQIILIMNSVLLGIGFWVSYLSCNPNI